MEWISMKDMVPELPDDVDSDEFLIAWVPLIEGRPRPRHHFYAIATWDKFEQKWRFTPGIFTKQKIEVRAWMPLPDEYIEEE